MKRHLKYRNPALNVPRRHEAVVTDIVGSDTPTVDSGVKIAQLFVGNDSLVSDIYQMKTVYNLSIHWRTISAEAFLWTSESVILPRM